MRCVTDWVNLRPLPRVAPWNTNRRARNWEKCRDEWATAEKTPLLVTAQLATPILHAESGRTHLDSILSFAALTLHPVACDFDSAAVVPLPLALSWVSGDGRPLWACTPLVAIDEPTDAREYWHKRYPAHRADFGTRVSANTTAGRWKEYRVPVRATTVDRLCAAAIGNASEIERLLGVVTHVGKKGSMGYGRVARWTVTPGRDDEHDILARRAVPVAFPGAAQLPGRLSPNRAWTPPYWYSPWWSDCVAPE